MSAATADGIAGARAISALILNRFFYGCSWKMAVVEPAAMQWSLLLSWAGYALGLVGIVLLIWSLLKQGVSFLGLVLLTAGFLLLLLHDFVAY